MASKSLIRWRNGRQAALDELETAHSTLGGNGPGRRYATQQINYAYAVLLSSQFQGYCRDLHSESIDHLVATTPVKIQGILRAEFLWNRKLDQGNPNSGNIGSDFNRLGIAFMQGVKEIHASNARRQMLLEELAKWRNAIAHQDFSKVGGPRLQLASVRRWRGALNLLAGEFDNAMCLYLKDILGTEPW